MSPKLIQCNYSRHSGLKVQNLIVSDEHFYNFPRINENIYCDYNGDNMSLLRIVQNFAQIYVHPICLRWMSMAVPFQQGVSCPWYIAM